MDHFNTLLRSQNPLSAHTTSQELVRYLIAQDVPFFMRRIGAQRDVPVILIDEQTIEKLESLLAGSLGLGTKLVRESRYDHGLTRIPGGQGQMLSFYNFNIRDQHQLNQTGIRSFQLPSFTRRMNSQTIETGYLLSQAEKQDVLTYYQMRKAGLVQYEFAWDPGVAPTPRPFNFIPCIGETCYSFGTSGVIGASTTNLLSAKIDRLKQHLWELTSTDIPQLLETDESHAIFEIARRELLNFDFNAPQFDTTPSLQQTLLHPQMFREHTQLFTLLERIIDHTIERDNALRVINTIIAIKSIEKHLQLVSNLRLNYEFWNWDSPRTSFLAVYHRIIPSGNLALDSARRNQLYQSFYDGIYENTNGIHQFVGASEFNRPVLPSDFTQGL